MVTKGVYNQGGESEYFALSTDDFPVNGVNVNSLLLELDTNTLYYFDGESWHKVGGDE